jgi:hypothetical protein
LGVIGSEPKPLGIQRWDAGYEHGSFGKNTGRVVILVGMRWHSVMVAIHKNWE